MPDAFGPDQGPDQQRAEGQGGMDLSEGSSGSSGSSGDGSSESDDGFFGPFGNPFALVSAYPAIAAAARFALTGDPSSETPAVAILDYLAPDALLDIISAYPCTGTLDTDPPQTTLTGTDLRYFNRAAGALVALALLNTPQAGEYARTLVKVKIGPVEETTQDGVVIEAAKGWLMEEYNKALSRIGCVAASIRDANRRVMGTPPSRGTRSDCGCRSRSGSPLYNGNRGGY